jgi:hypothetical protein
MDIGLDGVTLVSCEDLGGVEGLDDGSTRVEVDVISEGLKEVILRESERAIPDALWFVIGKALACAILTPVLAWALGGVALKPRSAKLIVLEIREAAGATFNAGFFAGEPWIETGLLGAAEGTSIFRRPPGE